MNAEKTVSVSFRVSQRFKALLESAAARENRSMTNMLETLLFEYCQRSGLDDRSAKPEPVPSEGATI